MMSSLASRVNGGSRSVAGRQGAAGYRSTLLARDENNLSMSPDGRNGLNKSASQNSIGRDERF